MLNNKLFKAVSNSDSGEVSEETIFHYRQDDGIIWGTYKGGDVKMGAFSGTIKENKFLSFHYQHLNVTGDFKGGACNSEISIDPEGKIVLHEKWKWTDGPSGESILREV